MLIKIQVEPLGDMFESKKKPGFFMREVLTGNGAGGREVIMVGASNAAILANLKPGSEMSVKPADKFFFAA